MTTYTATVYKQEDGTFRHFVFADDKVIASRTSINQQWYAIVVKTDDGYVAGFSMKQKTPTTDDGYRIVVPVTRVADEHAALHRLIVCPECGESVEIEPADGDEHYCDGMGA